MARRTSPQGWRDDDSNWPKSAGVGSHYFSTPWDAVDRLETCFKELILLEEQLGNSKEDLVPQMSRVVYEYGRCLSALYILDSEMARRKGTYGRLARLLEIHLARLPVLVLNGNVARYLRYLPEDLEDSGSIELAGEAIALQGAIDQAHQLLTSSRHEIPEDGSLSAEELLNIFLSQMEKSGPSNDAELIGVLRNFGDMCLEKGRYGDAKTLFRECLSKVNWLNEEPLEEHSIVLNQLGLAHRALNEFDEAENCYEQSLEIAQKLYEDEHENIATLHNNLGVLCRKSGKCEKARQHYEKACQLRKKLLGQKHPEFAASLMNLGALCYEEDELDEALVYYLRALDIWKATLDEKDQRIGGVLGNLGDLYHKKEQLEEAEHYYRASIKQLEDGVGPSHPMLAAPLLGLATLLKAKGEIEEGRNLELRGISLLPSSRQ